jgi:hypothetical protein
MIAITLKALAFLRDHWRPLLIATVALVVGAAGGRGCAPACPTCAPAVAAKDNGHLIEEAKSTSASSTTTGPEHRVERDFAPSPCAAAAPFAQEHARLAAAIRASLNLPAPIPAWVTAPPDPAPPGEFLAREIITDTGPSTTTKQATVDQHVDNQKHLDVSITPADAAAQLPRVSIWLEPQIKPDLGLHGIGADVRVTNHVWVGAWLGPQAPLSAGLSIRYSH